MLEKLENIHKILSLPTSLALLRAALTLERYALAVLSPKFPKLASLFCPRALLLPLAGKPLFCCFSGSWHLSSGIVYDGLAPGDVCVACWVSWSIPGTRLAGPDRQRLVSLYLWDPAQCFCTRWKSVCACYVDAWKLYDSHWSWTNNVQDITKCNAPFPHSINIFILLKTGIFIRNLLLVLMCFPSSFIEI